MSNQLDKFFSDRLNSISIEPGDQAWSRIERETSKKNKAVVWYRIAAVLCLVSLIGIWMYQTDNSMVDERVAQTENSNPVEHSDEINPGSAQNETANIPNLEEKNVQTKQKVDASKPGASKKRIKKSIDVPLNLDDQPLVASAVAPTTNAIEDEPARMIDSITESKSIVIVFELKPIPQQSNESQFVTLPGKKSGIKKVLEIAGDVRSGDSMLNGLRQAKEDIFALNFRKEDKSNND